ncbi:Alpha/Beta hydrolase protein [Ephemerocybe angulata]|uniref:Alpha/Beta hydrolase protein n=1 Tax=Ephemerocybe angulata TaxID=980116 RepID=A0A8H6HYQ5_9AGAR|nr:Alpha/Beta hydrolase protein [Tulosesus angulatus]
MSFTSPLPKTTLVYKTTKEGLDIHIDVWAPKSASPIGGDKRPAFVFFHGGGLAVGARDVWIPEWLFTRLTNKGYLFISADYRLIPPCTGYDIRDDVKDLWAYITNPSPKLSFPEGDETTKELQIDADAIAVGGSSAGGYCAYLAAMHCKSPKPKALVEIYGLGGQIFVRLSHLNLLIILSAKSLNQHPELVLPQPQNHCIRNPIPRMDRPLLPPIHRLPAPLPHPTPTLSHSHPTYAGPDHPLGPTYPSNPRMQLVWLYLQQATLLDYITGSHSPSFSAQMRAAVGLPASAGTAASETVVASPSAQDAVVKAVESGFAGADAKAHFRELFPQFNVTKGEWPPTVFLHGKEDTGLPVADSEHMFRLLKAKDVPREMYRVEGEEHSFDYKEGVEDVWGPVFDAVVKFVDNHTLPEAKA